MSFNVYEVQKGVLSIGYISTNPTFCSYTDADEMKFLMRREVVKNTAQFIQKAYMKRRRALYK